MVTTKIRGGIQVQDDTITLDDLAFNAAQTDVNNAFSSQQNFLDSVVLGNTLTVSGTVVAQNILNVVGKVTVSGNLHVSAVDQYIYNRNVTAGGIVSYLQAQIGMVGIWPFGPLGALGELIDVSGNGLHLSRLSSITVTRGRSFTYGDFDGVDEAYNRADEDLFDIIGGENFITSTSRGLTIGCIFWADTTGASQGLIGKWGAAGQRSYLLNIAAAGTVTMNISGDGTVGYNAASTAISTGAFHLAIGRFSPSTYVRLFLDGTEYENTTSIPASIFNSTAEFAIGRQAGANYLDGRASFGFLSTALWADNTVIDFYNLMKGLFATI